MHDSEFMLRSGPAHSESPASLHSPVLAAYWRLPRFLNGERGLFFAPVTVPEGRLEDIFLGRMVQIGSDGKRRAEWVRAAEDGASDIYRVREEEEKGGGGGHAGEKRLDVAQMLEAWGAFAVSINMCVCVCATCLWAGISRLVGPAWGCGASLCSKTSPASSERLPLPELQRRRRMGAWWRDSASPLPCKTHTGYNTHSSGLRCCCCHNNHNSMCGQTSEEKSCWELQMQKVWQTFDLYSANNFITVYGVK